MNRVLGILGSLLVLAGFAVLAYIGVTYARQTSITAPGWSHAQHVSAEKLRKRLSGRQEVALPSVQSAPRGEPALRMVIPKIGVDSRVVQTQPSNGAWIVADWAVGHLTTTPNPGNPGNGAYAAHDDIKGELFKRLAELAPGDTIDLYTRHGVYRYSVVNQQNVSPADVGVLGPTKEPTITLISCTPYWVDTQRLIVQATLKSSSAA